MTNRSETLAGCAVLPLHLPAKKEPKDIHVMRTQKIIFNYNIFCQISLLIQIDENLPFFCLKLIHTLPKAVDKSFLFLFQLIFKLYLILLQLYSHETTFRNVSNTALYFLWTLRHFMTTFINTSIF